MSSQSLLRKSNIKKYLKSLYIMNFFNVLVKILSQGKYVYQNNINAPLKYPKKSSLIFSIALCAIFCV